MADHVVIKIKGDDSQYQEELKHTEIAASAAAAKIAAEFRKAGHDKSDAMTKAWEKVKEAERNGTTIMIDGIEMVIRKNGNLADSFDDVADEANRSASKIERVFSAVKSGAASAIAGLKHVAPVAQTAFKGVSLVTGTATALWNTAGLAMVSYNGNLEQLRTSFEVMTGSAAKGAEVLERIRALGASTPFEMQGLAETTQLLMNYNLTADDAISKMTMLGDISQGDQAKLTRIATAYGQMSSAGKVALEDIKQMIEAGFNPLVEISETTGESMASLYKRISKGTLAVDEITASMERSTSAGGKYFQSMEKQSQTLNGQISTLKDNVQQLGGNVFQSYTDGLRDSMVPAANDIVEELNDAFMTRGMDGLTDAVIAQIPQVSSAVGTAFKNGIENAGKQAPKYIKGLISTLPSMLSGGGEVATALSDVFFDMVEAGFEGLIANSPEILGWALDFGVSLGGSIIEGVFGILGGLGRGFETALKKVGLVGMTEQDLLEQLFDGYDPEKVKELKAQVKITPETTVDESKVKLDSVYEMIAKQLTDGKADSPEVVAELKKQVTDYYNAEIEKVNQWKQEALAGLDTTLPSDEYAEAAAAIATEADGMIASLKSASDQTITFIDVNAGKSTAAVQDNLDDLDAIYQSAVTYRDLVAALTGEAGSMADKQRQVVAAGQSRDEATQLAAIGYTATEYKAVLEAAEAEKEAAKQKALEQFKEGTDDYRQAEEKILAEYEAKKSAAEASYLANQSSLLMGIAKAMTPEQQKLLEAAARQAEVVAEAQELVNRAFYGEKLDAEDLSDELIELLSLEGIDVAQLASTLDADALSAELENNLRTVIANGGNLDLQAVLGDMMETMPEEMKNVISAAIGKGWLMGVGDVDLTDPAVLLAMMGGQFANEAAETIGRQEVPVKVQVEPEVTGADGESIEHAVSAAVADAADGTEPVKTTVQVATSVGPGSDSGIEKAVNAELAAQEMDVQVRANVSLDVTLDDSNAGAVGEAAGITIGAGVAAGLASKNGDIRTAGVQAGQGFNIGLASQRAAILGTAKSIAKAAADAIAAVLDEHSPSRVTMRMGAFAGEGFDIGLTDSLNEAVKHAGSIAGSLNLSQKLTAPDLTGAFSTAAASMSEGMSQPIYLNVDGRTLAQVTVGNNARAANQFNRNIALGVGK